MPSIDDMPRSRKTRGGRPQFELKGNALGRGLSRVRGRVIGFG